MVCATRLRRVAVAALAVAAACGRAPQLADLPAASLPADAAPAITLESAAVVAGKVVVTYRLTDRGTPITGTNATALAPTWTLAWLSVEPVSGLPAWRSMVFTGVQTVASLPSAGPGTPAPFLFQRQPGAEASGATVELGAGQFTYTYSDALPGAFPLDGTLRVGVFLEGAAGTSLTSATLDFVPNGAALQSYGSVSDSKCNGCHGQKLAHRGKRTGVKLCLTCHTWLNADPDTVDAAAMSLGADTSDSNVLAARAVVTKATYPNPLEMGRFIHRIHRGKTLPTLYRSASCYTASTKTGVTAPPSTALCNVPTLPPTFPPNGPPPAPPLPPADLPWTVPALPFRSARNAIGPAGIKSSVIGEGGVELLIGRIGSRINNNQPAQTVAMGIGYPQDLRNCGACHTGDLTTGVTVTSISRRSCSGCHPDVWFGAVAVPADLDAFHMPHSGGPQANDSACRDCHVVKGSQSRWAPIADLHAAPLVSPRFKEPVIEIVEVQNLEPGTPGVPGPATATLKFTARDDHGALSSGPLASLSDPIPAWDDDPTWPSPVPRKITSLTFRIGGPNTDIVTGGGTETVGGNPAAPTFSRAFSYTAACSPSALTVSADATGVFTCTFANPLATLNLGPGKVEAQGYWTVGVEGRRASAQTQYPAPAPYTGTAAPNRPADWPWYGWVLGYDGDPGSPTYDTFRWPGTGETVTEAADNSFVTVDLATGRIATQPTAARRSIVAMDRCNVCHLRFTFHGARNDSRFCVFCHAPDATDWMYRPRDLRMAPVGTGSVLLWNPLEYPQDSAKAWSYWTIDGIEERSISLKTMVHRIHTGEREGAASLEGIRPFTIHTGPSRWGLNDEARYPNDLGNCEACHLSNTWTIESVPPDAMPTVANEKPWLLHLPTFDALGAMLAPAATSPDGVAWTSRALPTGNYGAVAAGGTTFAAVGASAAATSPNGITWTARTLPAGNYAAVAWSGTRFAAVGASVAATSTDGTSWAAGTTPAKSYAGVAWGGTPTPLFAAVGTSAAATSTDGTTWTARTIPTGTYSAVAWNGSIFAAVGSSVAATSADGITWTARTIPAGSYAAVTWGNGTFVAVGSSVAATSTDGITWVAQTIPVASFRSIAWTGGTFIAVGAGVATTSADGASWTWRSIPAGSYQAVAWNGAALAAVGYCASATPAHDPSEAVGAVTSSCLTCHTSGAAAQHAADETPGGVEQCASCHGANGAQSIRRMHAVP